MSCVCALFFTQKCSRASVHYITSDSLTQVTGALGAALSGGIGP